MSGATNDSVVSVNQQTEKRPLRAEVLYRAEVEASSDCSLTLRFSLPIFFAGGAR
jgi:hypothetical protein